jgi:hypothetical protein
VWCFECGNEPLGSIECKEILDRLRGCNVLKYDPALRSCVFILVTEREGGSFKEKLTWCKNWCDK